MKKLILLLAVLLMTTSCAISKKSVTKIKNQSIFNQREKAIITSGKSDDPLRVWLITNKQDSILLRKKSESFLVNKHDTLLQLFSNRLLATVKDSATRGVGIAAPQVGILKRIIWVKRLDKKGVPFEVYYNPVITKYTKKKQDVPEGCLSIPNLRATTLDRSYAIFFQYDNARGEHKCEMVEAFTAAIFQHEIDHLDGILFIDHLMKEYDKNLHHKIK